MANPFVWFDLRSKDAGVSRSFYEKLFGWNVNDVTVGEGTVPMIGKEPPWASIVTDDGLHLGWFPYIQVDDLRAATKRAEELGARALQDPTEGPAGSFTPVEDPGGAVFALFEPRP